MGIVIYPEYITIRLPEAEKKQLKSLIAAASAMGIGKKLTIKEYLTDLIVRSAAQKVVVPSERSVPVVRNEDVQQRITLHITAHTFDCLNAVRGTGKPALVNGEVIVQRANYGESDVVRELINKEWNELLKMLESDEDR